MDLGMSRWDRKRPWYVRGWDGLCPLPDSCGQRQAKATLLRVALESQVVIHVVSLSNSKSTIFVRLSGLHNVPLCFP